MYETQVEENRSIVESIPANTQPNPLSITTSSPTATRTQPPISQPNDQLTSTSSSNQNHVTTQMSDYQRDRFFY